MSKTKLTVVQNPEAPVSVEILAESIKAIADGMKKVLRGPLTKETIVLLVSANTPLVGSKYNKAHVSKADVRAVLEGIETLDAKCLKKP